MNSQDIVLSEDEEIELSRRVRSATISQRDGRRARVILLAARGCSRNEIAQLTGLSVVSVTRWCKRFQEQRLQGLVDLPGRGRKPSLPAEALKRTLEQVTQPRIRQPRWSCRSMPSSARRLDCRWESGISARNRTIMSATAPLPCSPRWIIFRGI
jgi:transposase